jgi:hypothetical protein
MVADNDSPGASKAPLNDAAPVAEPRWIISSALAPHATIDVTKAAVAAIANELHEAFGGNDLLNWIEAEDHLRRLLSPEEHVEQPTSFAGSVLRLAELRRERTKRQGADDHRHERIMLESTVTNMVTCLERDHPIWVHRAPRAAFAPETRICGRLGLVPLEDRPGRPDRADAPRNDRRRAPARLVAKAL